MRDEEYVRAHWKALGNLWWDREYDENWISASDEKGQPIRLFRGRSTGMEAWAAAAEFTRERLEQIRQLKREIQWCESGIQQWTSRMYMGQWREDDQEPDSEWLAPQDREDATGQRLVARLESALADLKRGMK